MEIAGETRSDVRMETSEGPRDTGTSRPGGLSYRGNIETRGLSYCKLNNFRRAGVVQCTEMAANWLGLMRPGVRFS